MNQDIQKYSELHYDYDSQFHDDEDNHILKTSIVGAEMYNPVRFIKDFHVWRFPHLTSRFVHLSDKFQLPGNSVLHILDNINHPEELLDTPRILTNPLIQNEAYRKWIYNVTKPDLTNDDDYTCPINIDWSSGEVIDTPTINKFIFRPAGMVSNFMKFRSEQKSNFRYLSNISEIPLKREALTIINHNPLFRMQLFGRLQFFRRMQLIWASILNTCCRIPSSKSQYIYVPLTNVVYPKEMFYRSKDKLNLVSVKQPNSYHYLFMMNYLNFINTDATTSMISRIPEEVQKKLTFILVNGDTALFHTLADIKTINLGNKAYLRIVNQLNMLSLRSSTDIQNRVSQVVEESSSPDTDEAYEEHIEQVDEVLAETKVEQEKALAEPVDEPKVKPIISGFTDKSKRISLFDSKKPTNIDTDDYDEFDEDELAEIDKLLKDDVLSEIVPPDLILPPDPDAKQVEQIIRNLQDNQDKFNRNKELEKSTVIKNIIVKTKSTILTNKVLTTDISTSLDTTSKLNIPAVQLSIAEDSTSATQRAANYVTELDAQTEALIDNIDSTTMTPKAKERMKLLSKKYKTLQIGNKTLESILLEPVSNNVRTHTLDFLDEQIPDKSMLKSSITDFDEEYLHHTFQRDMVSVITSFNKNGLFLIDVKEKPIINELNHLMEYTLQFEDINNKVSSIKYPIPYIDKNGHCYVNGVRKTMKKQMINLPICKVSPVRVSLSSNFNKTIVERNVTKAHSFNEYFNTLLLKIRKSNDTKLVNIDIAYGSVSTKTPVALSYEYSSLMKKINVFVMDTPISSIWCYFNYNNRFTGGDLGDELNPTPELLQKVQNAENTFGTYFGTIKVNKKYSYMFIDINNIVSVVDIQSGSVQYTTTLMELVTANVPNVPAMNPLTEWTDLKIADGKLPTIFVLAYRFGLFNILDYLGIDYTVIGRKDKKVIYNFKDEIIDTTANEIILNPVSEDKVLNDVLSPITGTEHFNINRDRNYKIIDFDSSGLENLQIDKFGQSDNKHVYHLSLKDLGNSTKFKPRTFLIDEALEVTDPPRICASDSIPGCIRALGEIRLFNPSNGSPDTLAPVKDQLKYSDYYVYAAKSSSDDNSFVSNDEIVKNKWVFDAHVTGECWFVRPTVFVKVGKIRIHNDGKHFEYKPLRGIEYFRNQNNKVKNHISMYDFKYTILETNKKFVTSTEALNTVEKYQYKPGDISVKFADVTLVFNRYPITQSLIVAGLQSFNTEFIESSAMETKSAYFTLLELKGMSTNYLKGIDSFFELFIDPITRDTLEQMNEPTNVRDLLIRATVLLSTNDHKEASSTANHKFRGYERFNAIVYNEMSRELANYRNRNSSGLKYSINPQAVLQRIIQDESMMPVQEINPIHDIKERTGFTYTGVGGRTSQSFVLEDRKYPADGIGIISEATVDSGKVAINAVASMDPSIINTRGLVTQLPASELEPTQVLSISSLLLPGATNDDGKRANFINIQLSHHIPTEGGEVSRIRTGYERVVAHQSADNFAGVAKQDGVIDFINLKLKMVRVKYDDGSIDTFSYNETYPESSGVCVTQRMECAFNQGDTIKRGDVVVYNKEFFSPNPYNKQVDWKHGVHAICAIMERNSTLQDSSCISRRLGEQLRISPTQIRTIALDKDCVVHDIVKIGQMVYNTDHLIVFEENEVDDYGSLNNKNPETIELLKKLNRSMPKAKYSGHVIKIDAFYGCETSEMHPSLSSIVKSIVLRKNSLHKFTADTDKSLHFPMSNPLPQGIKFKGIDMTENTVILQIYIKEGITAGVGDKLVFDASLKTVIGDVMADPIKSETGTEIDAVFSGQSINNRIITSPLIVGTAQRVVEKIEADILEMWEL